MALWSLLLLVLQFGVALGTRCQQEDNCICRAKNEASCPCNIEAWVDEGGTPRKRLQCSKLNLSGDPFFMNLTSLAVAVEELVFKANKIKSLDPEMFRDQTRWTGLFFSDNLITSINASLFENMTGLVKLDFSRNKITYIDAHLATNSPRLRRIETESNLITLSDTCGLETFLYRINVGELQVPLCWKPCPAGYFNSFNLSDECQLCAPGRYNNRSNVFAGTKVVQAVCDDCPMGKFGTENGTTSIDKCKDCPPGRYVDTAGDTLCDYCMPGRFSAKNGTSACESCTPGRYSGAGDSQCGNCSAGTYSGPEAGPQCEECSAGKYSDLGSSACLNCSIGKQSDDGAAHCSDCASGKYGPSEGLEDCEECPLGKHFEGTGATELSQCVNCSAGNKGDARGLHHCATCPAGTFAPSGSITCEACDAGKYSFTAAASCSDCPIGRFNPDEGQGVCQPCEPGRFGSSMGATNKSKCLVCPPGHFCNNPATVTACGAGTFSASQGAQSSATCEVCAMGSYASIGASSCTDCPSGQTTNKRSSSSRSDCVQTIEELLSLLPIFVVGAGVMALVGAIVLRLYCIDRKYVREERMHKKYLVPLSAVFGVFDCAADVYFVISLGKLDVVDRPPYAYEFALIVMIVPFVISLVCLTTVVCHQLRNKEFYEWFQAHAVFMSLTTVISSTNTSIFELTFCDLGGLTVFRAPWSQRTREILAFAGLLTNLLEDIPQLCLQLYVAQRGWSIVIVSLSFSVLSLFTGTLKHLFLLFGWCKHQRHMKKKHQHQALLLASEEPFVFETNN